MKRSWVPGPVVIVLAVFVVVACTGPQDEDVRKAQEIWEGHESVVAEAVRGEEYDADEFVRSVDFFRQVAGIDIHVEIHTMGYMPTADTSEDLEHVTEELGEPTYIRRISRADCQSCRLIYFAGPAPDWLVGSLSANVIVDEKDVVVSRLIIEEP